jgi:uridine kinase
MLFRKRTFKDTLKMFHSVEEGENKYIMPYKYRSTYDIDTFMPYEICAYKRFLAETLRDVSEEAELTDQVCRFLEASVPLNSSNITSDSLICEFIGNGQFSY